MPNADGPVAAVFLLRSDGAALFQLRDDKPNLRHAGMWVPPGGHQEPWEPIAACARRELREETGYDCPDPRRLAAFTDDQGDGWPPYELTVFWARYDGAQPLRCMEGRDLRFIERREAATFPIPSYLVPIWDMAIAALGQTL